MHMSFLFYQTHQEGPVKFIYQQKKLKIQTNCSHKDIHKCFNTWENPPYPDANRLLCTAIQQFLSTQQPNSI